MVTAVQLDQMKLALRGQVCDRCGGRGCPNAEECERSCPLFVNLARLARLVRVGEPPCGYGIYTKSLQLAESEAQSLDVVHALTVLEGVVLSRATNLPRGDASVNCETVARIATALACVKDGH